MNVNASSIRLYLTLIFLTVLLLKTSGQTQQQADSLWRAWNDVKLSDSLRMNAIAVYSWSFVQSKPDSTIVLAKQYFAFAETCGNKKQMANALNTMGAAEGVLGNSAAALSYHKTGLKLKQEINDKKGMSQTYNNMGRIYSDQGFSIDALDCYQKSMALKEELGDRLGMANTTLNLAIIYQDLKDFEKAEEFLDRAMKVYQETGNKEKVALTLSKRGTINIDRKRFAEARPYLDQALAIDREINNVVGIGDELTVIANLETLTGNHEAAIQVYQQALELYLSIGDKRRIGIISVNKGLIHNKTGDYKRAKELCGEALLIGEALPSLEMQLTACSCLGKAFRKMGNPDQALVYYDKANLLKDSLHNEENTRKFARMEAQYDFGKKEALAKAEQDKKDAIANEELRRKRLQRNASLGGFAMMMILAAVFFIQRRKISKEQKRSEDLLLNILPEETARELKQKGYSDAKLIAEVTVLFTDFKGFTQMSEKLSPHDLVAEIHECFSEFDRITERHKIEKIKTIGDAYMAAGGLPVENETHALEAVSAAIEIQKFMLAHAEIRRSQGRPYFEIRIGVHTGPVVAGIVGIKKFQYDIWGDTVNTASRMESSGEVGKVNISESTFQQVKDHFKTHYRGEVEAKGKGKIGMYFID